MHFIKIVDRFAQDDGGAVTVDWVVLTAAVVGLSVAAMAAVRTGTGEATKEIQDFLSTQSINSTF